MTGNAFLGTALLPLLALGAAGAEAPGKPFHKRLKAQSVDPATRTISVREPDLVVSWDRETRFLLHRSIRLKDLERGTTLHVLGRLHSARSASAPVSDSVIADVAFLGTGEAHEYPPLNPRGPHIRWHTGLLESTAPTIHLRSGDAMHRLAVAGGAVVYSLDKDTPATLPGKSIVVRGKVEEAAGGKDPRSVTRVLATEVHVVELEAEHSRVFQLQWGEKRKSPFGLRGEYFDNWDFTDLKLTRVDPSVNFDWGTGSPDPSMESDKFAIRWTGKIAPPSTGTFTFHVVTDDGARLWVDNRLIIDSWKGPADAGASIALVAGKKVDIRMEYYEGLENAFAKLSWSGPSLPRDIVPHTCLSPAPAAPSPPPPAAGKP